MASTTKRIVRHHTANGQTLLYNPKAAPHDIITEFQGVYGFNPKAAAGCLADVMISQRKGEFPPVAFMIISKLNRHSDVNELITKIEKAQNAFKFAYIVIIDGYPRLQEFQLEHTRRMLALPLLVSTLHSATKLMMAVYEKHSFELATKAQQIQQQMNSKLLTRDHAVNTLHFNFDMMTRDECDMLLDIFGTISTISQVSAAEILDNTVLNTDAAHAIEDFFKNEYVVE